MILNSALRLSSLMSQPQLHHNPQKEVNPVMPALLREAAAQGAVLLENRVLPFAKDTKISLFGRVQQGAGTLAPGEVRLAAPGGGGGVLAGRDGVNLYGTVKVGGTDAEAIVSNVSALLQDKEMYKRMSETHNPYGDGQACERIIAALR